MADLGATEATCEGGVVGKIYSYQARAWKQWIIYCNQISSKDDVFLDNLDRWQQNGIMGSLTWLCAEENFLGHIMVPWLKTQSEVPTDMRL